MSKRNSHGIMVLLALSLVLGLLSAPVYGESNLGVGAGASPTARLNFEIRIPTILYLQVGSAGAGAIDTVSCDLSNIPGSGAVAMTSTGPNTVRVAAVVPGTQNVRLLANSQTPLSAGGGNNILFSRISCTANGNFTSYTFNDTDNQVLETFQGSGNRTGTYAFTYANAATDYYPAGTYTGTVTYTLVPCIIYSFG
ncbi:MAG: hypothetical protein FJ121_06115 [Deltaproteobacteria bacterium]|nr:hypothetical protein [Deltaproteobacteria bacterium]MBM4301089.1 hypothetical protein [Deltaproteobacteria bacterium]